VKPLKVHDCREFPICCKFVTAWGGRTVPADAVRVTDATGDPARVAVATLDVATRVAVALLVVVAGLVVRVATTAVGATLAAALGATDGAVLAAVEGAVLGRTDAVGAVVETGASVGVSVPAPHAASVVKPSAKPPVARMFRNRCIELSSPDIPARYRVSRYRKHTTMARSIWAIMQG